jgi:hypothetical protein
MMGLAMERDLSKDIKEQTEQCVREITQRWAYFINTLRFKDDVPLGDIIDSFTHPIREFMRLNYPLLHSGPPNYFWATLFLAIQQAKTHTAEQVNLAHDELYQRYRTK